MSASPTLILYHDWGSTCSQKVRLALAEKQLPYEGRLVRLRRFEHLSDDFLALNPDAMVPVLIHEGFVIKESSVINEYLDAVFPDPPLQPADPQGRAKVGMWTRFIDHITSPAIKKPSFAKNLVAHLHDMGTVSVDEHTARLPSLSVRDRWRSAARGGFSAEELEDANTDLRRTLARMAQALQHAPWLAGPDYSLADVHAMPFVERIATLPGHDLPMDWPSVADWLQRVRARPAFARSCFFGPA